MTDIQDEIVIEVNVSPVRRFMALGVMLALGFILIWMAVTKSPAFGWQIFLIGLGVLVFLGADRVRRGTALKMQLTETELRLTDGTVLARIEDVTKVERGAFAFKPSNGFALTTKAKAPFGWQPGIWWRLGRRVGVGGMLPAGGAKFIAENIALRVASRDLPPNSF